MHRVADVLKAGDPGINAPRSDDERGGPMAFVDNTIEVKADIREVYDILTAFEDFP